MAICKKKSCFAYTEHQRNHCSALQDTSFGDKECPFYKSKEQYEQEREMYGTKQKTEK